MNNNNLSERIIKTIKDPLSQIWFPELTRNLVTVGCKLIKDKCELTLHEYGTNRVWYKDKNARHETVFFRRNPSLNILNSDLILVEILEESIIDFYKDAEVVFYEDSEITNTSIVNCINEAIDIVTLVPSMFETIFSLVRSMHLIKPKDNNYDISFSEPHIPFSIFISVPNERLSTDYLRVAEAIIHEAMHLQLTLIESVVPLIIKSKNKYYSPWKDEYRTAEGVLHALYVFRVLNSFFGKIINSDVLSIADENFLSRRKGTIVSQINKIRDFVNCPDLTSEGKVLASNLLFNSF